MTDQEHPITPPPELVKQWRNLPEYASQLRAMSMVSITTEKLQDIATQAARWGADQELEACCEWIYKLMDRGLEWSMDLRAARRPKPPSLKQQALEALQRAEEGWRPIPDDCDTIRRALESLPDQ